MGGMRWVLGIPALEESEYNFLAWQSPLFLLCAGRFHDGDYGSSHPKQGLPPCPGQRPTGLVPGGCFVLYRLLEQGSDGLGQSLPNLNDYICLLPWAVNNIWYAYWVACYSELKGILSGIVLDGPLMASEFGAFPRAFAASQQCL